MMSNKIVYSCSERRAGACPGLSARGRHQVTHLLRTRQRLASTRTVDASSSQAHAEGPGAILMEWLQHHGAPAQAVEIKTIELPGAGRPLDMVVAKGSLQQGQLALEVPENLIVTLDRIFESEFVAELLTTDKLSELAALTLYMMYEKKVGKKSFWYPFIKELDRQRARGTQAVESPLLWDAHELDTLLQGSPVVPAVKQRLAGIEKEYQALDTVWFMAGSLFNKYPFDIPTEAFSFQLFRQAFAAVQASTVHLQGVPIAKRFALVPLGPPLLSYSSTSKAMLVYNTDKQAIQLVADRDYSPGEPVAAWCGPQPNSRLLLNYGLVDENNPYDKLQLIVTIPNTDPLFQVKRSVLTQNNLATQQSFDLARNKPLPAALLPCMRVAYAKSEAEIRQVSFTNPTQPLNSDQDKAILAQLMNYFQKRLDAYKHPLWKDIEIISDPHASPRSKIAARLTKIEKGILMACQEELKSYGVPEPGTAHPGPSPVKLT